MYDIKYTTRMKQNVKLVKKRGKDIEKLVRVLEILASGQTLEEKYKDHFLSGEWASFKECHIEPDWLLIYKISKEELILYATATGSHSDLFRD